MSIANRARNPGDRRRGPTPRQLHDDLAVRVKRCCAGCGSIAEEHQARIEGSRKSEASRDADLAEPLELRHAPSARTNSTDDSAVCNRTSRSGTGCAYPFSPAGLSPAFSNSAVT